MNKISKKVLVTSNMWIFTHTRKTYLNITIYYVNSIWKLYHFLFDIISFQGHYTEKNIAIKIQKFLYEFNFKHRILGFTTNNASSMIACDKIIMDNLSYNSENHDFNHYRYVIHIFNFIA